MSKNIEIYDMDGKQLNDSGEWTELKHGGEVYEGADASDFPNIDLGKEVGRYEENNEHFVFHVNKTNGYNYLTIRMPEEGGDLGITFRLPTWEDWQQ
tara:strand:- start:278 stop:568 length:291 start_codon:yes stop_codon:yes gene_type:complete